MMTESELARIKKAKKKDKVAMIVISVVASTAIFAVLFIFLFIFREAKDVLFDQETRNEVFGTFWGTNWQPVSGSPKYGIIPLIVGTLKTTLIAMMIAVPLSVLAAIYSAVFAPPKVREFLKPSIELLAGIPSVVIGFFALVVIATIIQDITGSPFRLNAFVGGVAISLTAMPIIFTLSEEALTVVPRSLWEGSYALGASKWETTWRIAIPSSLSGILAGILLGIGRSIGETLIVLMATGNAAITSTGFLDSTRTLTATIGAEMAEVVFGETHYTVLFFIGVILFVFTLLINVISEFVIKEKLLKKLGR